MRFDSNCPNASILTHLKLWVAVAGKNYPINPFSTETVFRRQILTSKDGPALKNKKLFK